MLIFANGAFKSGSTWMRDIVQEIVRPLPFPPEYQHPDMPHWLDAHRIRDFIDSGFPAKNDYLTKSHLYRPKYVQMLAGQKHVKVLNIQRDVRDVVVSAYFHISRERKKDWTFEKYYYWYGRYKAYQVLQYNRAWQVDADNIAFFRFEDLKRDYAPTVRYIAKFLNRQQSDEQIETIRRNTSIEKKRKEAGEADKPENMRFYRKGAIGDYARFFSPEMEKDLQRITQKGLSPPERLWYELCFTMRLTIRDLFRG